MKKHILAAGAAVLALGFSVGLASAGAVPCVVTYQHPSSAKSIKSALTQAFVSCNSPNATTETGTVPTCAPAQTYNEGDGSPAGGWLWGAKSKGTISFKAGKNKVVNALNTDPNAVDLYISVKMSGIEDENGPSDGAGGVVQTVSRATLIDRLADVLMTVIDFPVGYGITTSKGKVSSKTSATAILNGLGQPDLPACSNIEVVSVLIKDPNGNTFANLGTFLP